MRTKREMERIGGNLGYAHGVLGKKIREGDLWGVFFYPDFESTSGFLDKPCGRVTTIGGRPHDPKGEWIQRKARLFLRGERKKKEKLFFR